MSENNPTDNLVVQGQDVSGTAAQPKTAPSTAPEGTTELNLAERKDLDRSPDEVGKELAAAGGGSGENTQSAVVREQPFEEGARDATRQTIALWLIGLLCVIVALTFVALLARGASSGFSHPEFFRELKQVLDVLVGPVITLLASAVGFYFGYKQGSLAEQANKR
jgi:hypothetical protein